MHELRLIFAPTENGSFTVTLEPPGVPVPFKPFLTDNDYENLRWYLEDFMDLPDGGAVIRARGVEDQIKSWGHRLHEAVFSAPENAALLAQLLASPEPRELTIATDHIALLRLPWELLADAEGSLAQRVSVRRQLEKPQSVATREVSLPLRILYIVSRPPDEGFINPRATSKAVFDALEPLGSLVQMDFCRPPTLLRMCEMLRSAITEGNPYDVVHFDGHGDFDREKDTGVLAFEKTNEDFTIVTHEVPAVQFGCLIDDFQVPLVVLESCRSAQMKANVSGSIAARLLRHNVGSVVAMSHSVLVQAAGIFSACFYKELAAGHSVGHAVARGRKALSDSPVRWLSRAPGGLSVPLEDWMLPQLYQRGADDVLCRPDSLTQEPPESQRPHYRLPPAPGEPGCFPSPPRFSFHGRAGELHRLERTFSVYRGIVLHAMGGMGKTTLASEAAQWWTRSGLFRDGACFVSFERTVLTADRIITALGEYCEGPRFHQRPATEQRRRAIEFLRDHAILMVWDNYESALPAFHQDHTAHDSLYTDAIRAELASLFHDLTTGPGLGGILVTCRPGETGLPGAARIELHGLARPDSLWLLHRILERDGASLSDPRLTRDHLDSLLRDLADHPLSLELVGPHLRTLTPAAIRADFARLVETLSQDSDQTRNTSLHASLEFSRRHLSPAARTALPWLGLFSGGVFEHNLLDISQMTPEAWSPIRQELEGIALLRPEIEDGATAINDRPFLRFHPTLAIASAEASLAESPQTRERFLYVYHTVVQALKNALRGSQPRAALAILDREEMNYRTAVRWAIADGQLKFATDLGNTFCEYLDRSGRLRERDAWVQTLHAAVQQVGFTEEAAAWGRRQAWTRFAQGDPQGAVDQLTALVARLRQTTEFDPAFQLAASVGLLGRVFLHFGAYAQAISVLQEAIGLWEKLLEGEGDAPWQTLLTTPDHRKAADELGNLSAAIGDLAFALDGAGQNEEALDAGEKCVVIQRARGDVRGLAVAHGRCAKFLMCAGRYDEADARYEQALAAAVQAGDKVIEGSLLQHKGNLADDRNQPDRATRLYQQALQRFQDSGHKVGVMQTYNSLGVTERKAGRLAEARAWYEQSRTLAAELQDQPGLGQAAQNIGIVCKLEGEAARARGDEPAARRHLDAARRSVQESLAVSKTQQNQPDEAGSLGQLARIHLLLGDLDTAARHAHAALKIHESLGLKEAYVDYNTLSEIAAARGDTAAAAEWAQKRDALRAELEERAGGGGDIPARMLEALAQLTLACARARFGDAPLGPAEEEALATLDGFPAPFPDFTAHLRHLAAGEMRPIPPGLPKELHGILSEIDTAVREQTGQ